MEHEFHSPKPRDTKPSGEPGNLMSLVQLQEFLADELSDLDEAPNLTRSFQPLTDGLGLDSPLRHDPVAQPPSLPPPVPTTVRTAPKPIEVEMESEDEDSIPAFLKPPPSGTPVFEPVKAKRRLNAAEEVAKKMPEMLVTETEQSQSLLAETKAPASLEIITAPRVTSELPLPAPPPMPTASLLRRGLTGIVDEIFMVSCFVGAMILTSNVISGFRTGLSEKLFTHFSHPVFIRLAALEFTALWLAYLAVCFGLLDMTFGMWVWGTRLGYGDADSPEEGRRFWKKLSRIVFSFLIFAPILPTVLLVFCFGGRTLLDRLTGTRIYRSLASAE